MKALYIILSMQILSCNKQDSKEVTKHHSNDKLLTSQSHFQYVEYGCGYTKFIANTKYSREKPKIREVDEFNKILKYVGLPLGYEIYGSNVKNAVALLDIQRRIILYNEALLSETDRYTDAYWSSISIIAHELGHHLAGHTFNMQNRNSHIKELEADKFSGFVLFKMGAKLNEACTALNLLADKLDSDSHPNKYKRIEALRKGWLEAKKLVKFSAVPPPPTQFGSNDSIYLAEYPYRELFRNLEVDTLDTKNPYYLSSLYNVYEGVIVDYSQPTYASEDYGITDPMDIYIYVTKVPNHKSIRKHHLDEKVKVHLLDFSNICHVCYENLIYLIKAGRPIRFSDFYEKSENKHILTSIKAIAPIKKFNIK